MPGPELVSGVHVLTDGQNSAILQFLIMRKLLFFCRVTFICNVCFVLVWLMKYLPPMPPGHIASTILVLGIGVSFLLNVLINLIIIVCLLQRKPVWEHVPRWLVIANILILIPQIILLLK
jgi:hypothetical protein